MTEPVATMDDATVCFAWRTSYVALQQHLPLHCRLRIVERRREILDDLERRNARGVAAWLEAGARAAGDPTKYVTAPSRRGSRSD